MKEEHIINQKIKELGKEQKVGNMTWQQVANIVNSEFGTQLSEDACRKRYDRVKITTNYGDTTTFDIEEIIELTPTEKLDRTKVLSKIVTDPENWEILNIKISEWMQHTKEQTTKKLYAVKVTLKAKQAQTKPIDLLKEVQKVFKEIKPLDLKPIKKELTRDEKKLMELPGMELHLGKLAWEGETGQNYDHHIAQDIFYYITKKTIEKQLEEQCGSAILYIGNDFFNSEANGTTTKGTPQDNDLRYLKMFSIGIKMYLEAINEYRKHFNKVYVKLVPGNHDEQMSSFLYVALELAFAKDNIVEFSNNYLATQCFIWGKCGIFSNHGDSDLKRLIRSISAEFPKEWGNTKFRELHLGHLHKEVVVDDEFGMITRRIGSPSKTDKFHYKNRYIGAVQKYQTFIWHKDNGLLNIHYINTEYADTDKKKHQKVLTR